MTIELIPIYLLALGPILLSVLAIAYVLQVDNDDILWWAIRIGAGLGFFFFVFFSEPWTYSSDYLRYALLAVMALAVLFAYFNRQPSDIEDIPTFPRAALIFFGLFSALNGWLLSAYFPFEDRVSLRFPLADGLYAVAQGGGNVLSNPFHALQNLPYAFDFVLLDRWRARAETLAPKSLNDYYIFEQNIYSPCDGVVKETKDNEQDHPPGGWENLIESNMGNYIKLQCDNAEILMSHMRLGSVIVVEGEKVRAGTPLGKVGNSGNSLEPHLHVAATRYGRPAGISFNRRVLVTNSTISAPSKEAHWPVLQTR